MSKQAAALQMYNNELVKCIEEMSTKRDEIHRQILMEEIDKNKIQADIRALTERLAQLIASLSEKHTAKQDCDKIISDTESAYMKIIEGSQTLIHALKKGLEKDGKSEN